MLRSILSAIGVYKLYEKWLWLQIRSGRMPEHVGIILDGNRRWAASHSLSPWDGHKLGAERVRDLLRWCLDLNVKILTLYVFSTENFRRPREEVEQIMKIAEEKLAEVLTDKSIHENQVRIKAIGRLNLLPENIQKLIHEAESRTANYDRRFLNIAIAYGGRAEITDATRQIVHEVLQGKLDPSKVDEDMIEDHLYTSHLPKQDLDLVIRTSGEERLSGFLLWQGAYSELCFLDIFWPEFRKIDLWRTIRTYQHRNRRHGS